MRKNKELLKKITAKKTKIAIIGLGYVGLPLAILFAKRGFSVTGFARNLEKLDNINLGQTEFTELNHDIKKYVAKNKFIAKKLNTKELATHDIFIICLPTPVNRNKNPDISALKQCSNLLGKINITNKFIINESTVAPFTTQNLFGNFGKDYFLACSPERVDPGINAKTTEKIPKLIGASDDESLELGLALYGIILKNNIIPVSAMEVAEMSKMLENTYRAVNIALSNEFALLAEKLNIDILEIIKAAKSKWSYQAHYPGIGVGGHCIPVDPYYVLALGKKNNINMPLISTGLQVNEKMPNHLFEQIKNVYEQGKQIFVYGLSYKKDIPDLRESPVLQLCNLLKRENISFVTFDPYITKSQIKNMGFEYSEPQLTDILIVGTDHKNLKKDWKKIVYKKTIIIDSRNYFKKRVGKKVIGVGRSLL